MYIVSEPLYAKTNWYQSCVCALKNQARKKRIQLILAETAEETAGQACVLVLGTSVAWLAKTVATLQEMGVHPILINELPDYPFGGKYSCVKTDYNRFMGILAASFARRGKEKIAFYGMNHASFADISRRTAFESYFPSGIVFENNGSLADCFENFYRAHRETSFDAVICANDFAAVSLLSHLVQNDAYDERIVIAVHSNAQLLTRFPQILSIGVDYSSVAVAAFEIADCLSANPSFVGMRVTVDPHTDLESAKIPAKQTAVTPAIADPIYADAELSELMRIEKLLSSGDEIDLQILRCLSENCNAIGESTFLSDSGVKYRIKKMKKICDVPSKLDILRLLSKYGVEI